MLVFSFCYGCASEMTIKFYEISSCNYKNWLLPQGLEEVTKLLAQAKELLANELLQNNKLKNVQAK